MSLVCAFAWDYNSLLCSHPARYRARRRGADRCGLYQRVTRRKNRGRFVLLYELVFPIGLVAASLTSPLGRADLGWQWMFSSARCRRSLRCSCGCCCRIAALARRARPRRRGRRRAVVDRARDRRRRRDTAAPAAAGGLDLDQRSSCPIFRPTYLRRTLVVWVIWFAAYFINYGLVDLAADDLPHRVQAAARRIAALRPDHPGGRLYRHVHLRADDRSCWAAACISRCPLPGRRSAWSLSI